MISYVKWDLLSDLFLKNLLALILFIIGIIDKLPTVAQLILVLFFILI